MCFFKVCGDLSHWLVETHPPSRETGDGTGRPGRWDGRWWRSHETHPRVCLRPLLPAGGTASPTLSSWGSTYGYRPCLPHQTGVSSGTGALPPHSVSALSRCSPSTHFPGWPGAPTAPPLPQLFWAHICLPGSGVGLPKDGFLKIAIAAVFPAAVGNAEPRPGWAAQGMSNASCSQQGPGYPGGRSLFWGRSEDMFLPQGTKSDVSAPCADSST